MLANAQNLLILHTSSSSSSTQQLCTCCVPNCQCTINVQIFFWGMIRYDTIR